MNNKKQNKQPLFAEVNLTGDEFEISVEIDYSLKVFQFYVW